MMFVFVWRYAVRPGAVDDFCEAYGPHGDWARLFRRSPAFLGVELIAAQPSHSYLTIDRWESETAFDSFMDAERDGYAALDHRLATLTESEQLVLRGHPVEVDGSAGRARTRVN
jgi:heme-degrading monooxygenase HmoA